MLRTALKLLAATPLLTLAALGVACSDSGADPAPAPKCDPAPANVSFKNHVQPIFQESCGLTSCHGNVTASAELLFLGSDDSPASDSNGKVYGHIVNVASREAPSTVLVSPGDPDHSFLMRKLDGDFRGITCGPDGCGDSMPQSTQELLPFCTREIIRTWIREGAQDN
jgi:hypothetical protein